MSRSESPSAAAPVRIGGYSLDVGGGSGSFARFEPKIERDNARRLKAALTQDEDKPPAPVAAIEEFQETVDAVTGRIEQADKLLTAAASRQLLEPGNLNSEIDALLGLFGRLDRAGRFEEQLKLMRSLNGLLALTLRWIDLIRSLRTLLRSATAAGHQAGQAFAHHELGSLNLCAGRAKDAARHLSEALRIEKQLGDFASQCATRHNLDSARRDTLARRAWRRSRRQLGASILVAAALILLGGGGGTGLALAIRGGGGGSGGSSGGGGHHNNAAKLIVRPDFEPNASTASVTVSVTCTKGGQPDRSQKAGTEAAPAVFYITGLGKGAACTATETSVSTGYNTSRRSCQATSFAAGETRVCSITYRRVRRPAGTSGTLTVSKEFSDKSSATVGIAVSCDGGSTVVARKQDASPGSPAVFTISGFGQGATCAATEDGQPAGYTADATDCRRVAITDGQTASCRIIDTPTTATLDVRIDYTDAGPIDPVNVDLSCTGGKGIVTPMQASLGKPAVFTVTNFSTGATCTATGDKVAGYSAPDASDCLAVLLGTRGECTIVYEPSNG